MKFLIFIEHDVVVRHFIHSGAFRELIARHDVTFALPQEGYKRLKLELSETETGAPIRRIPVHQERLAAWQRLLAVSRMRWKPGAHYATMRRFQRLAINNNEGEWTLATARYVLRSLPLVYNWYRRRQLRYIESVPNTALEQFLATEKPDAIIHPCVLSGVYLDDLTVYAQKLNTPLVVVMNSWDNPATKHSSFGLPDWLLVWGPQTRNDAVRYMGMPREQIVEFGAAQFDVYRTPARIGRAEFRRRNDLPEDCTVVLYAGSSKEADEFAHLQALDAAIERGELPNVKILYRPHPWGGGGAGGHRIVDYPWKNVRIESTMRAYLERVAAGSKEMYFPDYRNTHDALENIDGLLSPLSTIILEAAMHGKPVMCYMPEDEKQAQHFHLTRGMAHFDDMFTFPELVVENRMHRLVAGVQRLLEFGRDPDYPLRVAAMCEHFVKTFDASFAERICKFMENLPTFTPQSVE